MGEFFFPNRTRVHNCENPSWMMISYTGVDSGAACVEKGGLRHEMLRTTDLVRSEAPAAPMIRS